MNSKLSLLYIICAVFLTSGTLALVQAWKAPSEVPPAGNVSAPINVGFDYQSKKSDLGAIRMRAGQYCNAAATECLDIAEIKNFMANYNVGGPSAKVVADSGNKGVSARGVSDTGHNTLKYQINFNKTFSEPPSVSIVMSSVIYNESGGGDECRGTYPGTASGYTSDVTKTGFTLTISDAGAPGGCPKSYTATANWTAIGI